MIKKISRNGLIFGAVLLIVTQAFIPLAGTFPTTAQESNLDEIIEKNNTEITMQDDIPPEISDVSYPYIITVPAVAKISAVVTDNVAVEAVKLNIELPSGTLNYTMTKVPNTDTYSFDIWLFLEGEYDFFIWAIDTSGNANMSAVFTIEGKLSAQPPEPGSLGECRVEWDWYWILPGVGYIRCSGIPTEPINLTLNCTNGFAVMEEISLGWRVLFKLGPYLLTRCAAFYLNCYLDNKNGELIGDTRYKWCEHDGYNDGNLILSNVEVPCEGLEERTVFCEIQIAPRLLNFIPWLTISHTIWVEIIIHFNPT